MSSAEQVKAGESRQWICAECGKAWGESALSLHQVHLDRRDGSPHCANRPDCRGRQLTTRHGWDRRTWGRTAREHWYGQMDIRPVDWRETGWQAKQTEMERVEAAIHYLSLCWPACMPYACLLNSDESDVRYDEYSNDGIMPARERDLVKLLNMSQQSVNRAIRGLVARHKLIVEDGRYFPNPNPTPLSIAERQALNAVTFARPDDQEMLEFLRAIPKSYRAKVGAIIAFLEAEEESEAEEGAGADFTGFLSQFRDSVGGACTTFATKLRELRSAKNSAIHEACTAAAIISPRILELLNRTDAPRSAPAPEPSPAAIPPQDGTESFPLNQQYADLLPAPYTEADLAEAFANVRAWQEHYPKIQFGASPVSVDVPEDRTFMRGVFLRLRGTSAEEACDARKFWPWAYLQIFPDPNSLGKALPHADSIGVLYRLAERFRASHAGSYGATEREQQERQRKEKARLDRRHLQVVTDAAAESWAEQAYRNMPEDERVRRRHDAEDELRKEARWSRIPRDVQVREIEVRALATLREEWAPQAK